MNFYFFNQLIIFMIFLQTSFATLKFNSLWATDLKSNNVSFNKYENKLILLYQISPFFHKPNIEVNCLNNLYDFYSDRGLEIVVFSSSKLSLINRRFRKFEPKFDVYSGKWAKNVNEFLKAEPLAKLEHRCMSLRLF